MSQSSKIGKGNEILEHTDFSNTSCEQSSSELVAD